MDVKSTFRKLITNQFVPDFDYMNTEWTFKTVYHVSKYSYCICPCAFEHEYLDYIGDDGTINDEVFEKLTKSILDNQCPHVSLASEDHVDITGIYGIHIALAIGTDKAVCNSYFLMPKRFTKVYKLDPFIMAIIKNKHSVPPRSVLMSVLMNSSSVSEDRVQFFERSRELANVVIGEEVSILDICIRRGNIVVLESFVEYGCCENGLGSALKLAFKNQLFEIIKYNLGILKFAPMHKEVEQCLKLSIVYDQPYLLDFILKNMTAATYLSYSRRMILNDISVVLKRDNCKSVLTKYGIYNRDDIPTARQIETLWELLDESHDDFNDEIATALNEVPGLSEELNKQRQCKWSFLQKDILGFPERRSFQVLKTALELRANPNQRHYIESPLVDLLSSLYSNQAEPTLVTRRKVELFLYQNLDIKANTGAIIKSLRADARLNMTNTNISGSQRCFIVDSKPRGVFGHDSNQDFVFNFYTPLLIACGFPIPAEADDLLNQDDTYDDVPLVVKEYVLRALTTPKSLADGSRDVLRKHYTGCQIHTFVQQPCIPQQIRDIILLRSLLKCLSGVLY